MNVDPYASLELPWGASEPEIRQSFRRLALRYHPDRNPGDAEAEARFKRISAAFQRLKSAGFHLPPPVAAREPPRPTSSSAPPRWSPAASAPDYEDEWEPAPRPEFWPDGARVHYPTQREVDDLMRSVERRSASAEARDWSDRLVLGGIYLYFALLALVAVVGVRSWLGLN